MAAPVQRPRAPVGAAAATAGAAVGVARDLPVRGGVGAIDLDGPLLVLVRSRGDACGADGGSWGGRRGRRGLHAVGGGVPDAAGDGAVGFQQ